ncbi:MAG TPA: NrtA/SsuA/CpmA family ABC transporter substrate-binding protein [Syntrophobacteraceae bacterium]|nr:NrtA/SsuA/CpmA family ABC transporter substrate-binding protein [Syntrophobacteraceae bacterium]
MKGQRAAILLSVLLLFLSGFFLPTATGAGTEPVRVGTWRTAQTLQPFYYERFLSVPVRVFPFTNPADQKLSLLAGSLDLCGTTLALAIQSAARGEPVVVVAALCNKCSALVVARESTVRTPKDLRDKRIGYVPGTMHEILLRETLARAGLRPDKDVKLVRIDFFDMGTALAGGAVDAFLSGEPFPALSEVKGYGRVLEYPYFDDAVGTINAGLLVTRQTVLGRPDLVQSLVTAHARATEYLKANPDEWLGKASQFGTDLAVWKRAAENIELTWEMDESYVQKARALGRRMQEFGIIEKQPDYAALFHQGFVTRAREDLGLPGPGDEETRP